MQTIPLRNRDFIKNTYDALIPAEAGIQFTFEKTNS